MKLDRRGLSNGAGWTGKSLNIGRHIGDKASYFYGTSRDVYGRKTLDFRMFARRPFNPNEVVIFTSEKNVTRILKYVDLG